MYVRLLVGAYICLSDYLSVSKGWMTWYSSEDIFYPFLMLGSYCLYGGSLDVAWLFIIRPGSLFSSETSPNKVSVIEFGSTF